MRDYAKVSPNFWTGQTGRRIVAAGPECITVSMYLMTTGHANMIGIYYCPLAYICHDTGLSHEGALKALQRASEAGFCAYDEGSGWVYVPKMALWQIGSSLKASDNQVKAIRKEYERMPNNPFLKRFFEDYGEAYHLETERVFEAPSKPLTNPLRSQEQEQEQEQKYSVPDGTGAAAPPPLTLSQSGELPAEKPPPDPIFGTGLELLVGKGVTDRSARSFLGLLRRDVGDLVTGELLAEVERQDITDPIPWLRKAAESRKQSPTKRGGMVRAGSKDYGVGPNGEF